MRICSGFTIGTVQAHLIYLQSMEQKLRQSGAGGCNDQAVHNILIWGDLLRGVDVFVWDYFRGPVKTLDVGYLQDEFGRIINDDGLPYCVVHQYKADRNAQFFQGLTSKFPLHRRAERVHLEDTRFLRARLKSAGEFGCMAV